MNDILTRARSGALTPGERVVLADLLAALLELAEAQHAAQRSADAQAASAARVADSRARVDATLAVLLANDGGAPS